jgi:uncharacterized OB-fold protein
MDNQNCSICHSFCITQYFYLKTNGLVALKCKDCGHIFIKNSPINPDNISEYYTMDDFKGHRKLQDKSWYTALSTK